MVEESTSLLRFPIEILTEICQHALTTNVLDCQRSGHKFLYLPFGHFGAVIKPYYALIFSCRTLNAVVASLRPEIYIHRHDIPDYFREGNAVVDIWVSYKQQETCKPKCQVYYEDSWIRFFMRLQILILEGWRRGREKYRQPTAFPSRFELNPLLNVDLLLETLHRVAKEDRSSMSEKADSKLPGGGTGYHLPYILLHLRDTIEKFARDASALECPQTSRAFRLNMSRWWGGEKNDPKDKLLRCILPSSLRDTTYRLVPYSVRYWGSRSGLSSQIIAPGVEEWWILQVEKDAVEPSVRFGYQGDQAWVYFQGKYLYTNFDRPEPRGVWHSCGFVNEPGVGASWLNQRTKLLTSWDLVNLNIGLAGEKFPNGRFLGYKKSA
jgi:hypothetical protein